MNIIGLLCAAGIVVGFGFWGAMLQGEHLAASLVGFVLGVVSTFGLMAVAFHAGGRSFYEILKREQTREGTQARHP